MPDLKLGAQQAVFDKLVGSVTLTGLLGGARIWQHPPEIDPDDEDAKIEPPLVVISDMSATAFGGKDGGLDRIEVEIMSWVRAPGREHLTPIMTAIRDALEDQELTPPAGVLVSRPMFESDDDSLLEDGQTYEGSQRFSLFAQPA